VNIAEVFYYSIKAEAFRELVGLRREVLEFDLDFRFEMD
jgi:hypothetical protein